MMDDVRSPLLRLLRQVQVLVCFSNDSQRLHISNCLLSQGRVPDACIDVHTWNHGTQCSQGTKKQYHEALLASEPTTPLGYKDLAPTLTCSGKPCAAPMKELGSLAGLESACALSAAT